MALTHKQVSRWGAWSGWIFIFGFLIAVSPWLGGNIPASLLPTDPPEVVKSYFVSNKIAILVGSILGMIASAFWYVWGGTVAALLRRVENGRPPILYSTQIAATGVARVFLRIPLLLACFLRLPCRYDESRVTSTPQRLHVHSAHIPRFPLEPVGRRHRLCHHSR